MKYSYCLLERFNNYFNRKVIKYDKLEDYLDKAKSYFIPETAEEGMTLFDFNPNDNITSEIIVNDVPFDPDYFLLLDGDTIVQRWFVLEQKRNRNGQWVYFIKRDVLAEAFDELATAPMYVEKGIIEDLSSPLLLHNEDLKVNQIKKDEILLKDRTNCAWLVLYLKKGVLGNNQLGPNEDGKIPIDVPSSKDYTYIEINTPITSWGLYQYINSDYKLVNNLGFCTYFQWVERGKAYVFTIWTSSGNPSSCDYRSTNRGNLGFQKFYAVDNRLRSSSLSQMSLMSSEFFSAFTSYKKTDNISEYNGKIIKDSLGKYYLVRVYTNTSSPSTMYENVTSTGSPALKTTMTQIWREAGEPLPSSPSYNPNDNAFQAQINVSNLRIELTELESYQTEIDVGAYTGKGTIDSPLFDVVCMPYGTVNIYGDNGNLDLDTEQYRSMTAINSFARALTSQYVFDIQVLPYCPVQNLISATEDAKLEIETLNDTCIFGISGGNYTDAMIVCSSANFTFDIVKKITLAENETVPSNFRMKYINDCTMIRLCSPNYNGLFEMNLAKNGGSIESFNVDVTLRPFNPYIHVNPYFDFLYGKDFNDVRGLICGGDFSLGIINDAWTVYEIQNKNYQAIFDRQIQNLDVNNAITMQESMWGAGAGVVQGASAGAIGGSMIGGGWGAVAGGIIGAGASAVGGYLDIANLEKRQQETRNYAIDNYNLSLGNVRALPYSVTKTSALTYNNKLFPFIEIYECSDEEKEAYYLKLQYSGMTVAKISTIQPFTSQDNSKYFRAKLIRMLNISEDTHFLDIINEELMKGVFI